MKLLGGTSLLSVMVAIVESSNLPSRLASSRGGSLEALEDGKSIPRLQFDRGSSFVTKSEKMLSLSWGPV